MKPNIPFLLTLLAAFAASLPRPVQAQSGFPQWFQESGMAGSDSDGDGIPDAWERRTFGDPDSADAGLDRDGDGLTDLEEFALGTDPRDSSTAGDIWTDSEKVGAGLDPLARVEPIVTLAQWLDFLGWDGQAWRSLTATNVEGFAVYYADFVYNTAPYSDTNLHATVDFWLRARIDRPALLTIGDALTTNSFPLPAGRNRVRLRAAYGGAVSLTLDPLPGTLAEVPGATNGAWLCETAVGPVESNTLVFAEGETPASVAGDPPGVNGILVEELPASKLPPVGGGAPRTVMLPLRVTNGVRFLGGEGKWWCICVAESPCPWPTYDMIDGGCPGGATVNGTALQYASDPLISKAAAGALWEAAQPCDVCSVALTVRSASYPFLYERVAFLCRPCSPEPPGVWGAEQHDSEHTPRLDEQTWCGGIGGQCYGGPVTVIGFDHNRVNKRNLTRIMVGNQDEDTTEHCLGVVWSAGGKLDLFSLLEEHYAPYKGDLSFTSDNLAVDDDGKLEFGDKPKDMNPDICLIKLFYKSNQEFDKLWAVVNSPDTQTLFNDWYETNHINLAWVSELPPAYISLGENNSDPEPNVLGINGNWYAPSTPFPFYHHTSAFEMRSKITEHGHGQQACYTASGSIAVNGIKAGTADLFGPGKFGNQQHGTQDVDPYVRSLQLDGNPVKMKAWRMGLTRPVIYEGAYTGKYIECRPVCSGSLAPMSQ